MTAQRICALLNGGTEQSFHVKSLHDIHGQPRGWLCPKFPSPCSDYERVAEKAKKMEEEVKRLHQLIMDTNNKKLKAQQDKIDQLDKEMDECSSAITKAQVAAKTADRYRAQGAPGAALIHCLC